MTSRERVLAVLAGQVPDEKPVMIWPHEEMYSDIAIAPTGRLNNNGSKSRIQLAEVLSPFSRAIARQIKLNEILQEDPAKGEEILGGLIQEAKSEIEAALKAGADGIFYRLQGAEPTYSSPMEYGGHYLEVDREILATSTQSPIPNTQHPTPNTQYPTPNTQHPTNLNVLFVEGGPETYIDFVSDLPAAVFAWDCERTDVPVATLRRLRRGVLATSDRDADILFGNNYGILHRHASAEAATSNV